MDQSEQQSKNRISHICVLAVGFLLSLIIATETQAATGITKTDKGDTWLLKYTTGCTNLSGLKSTIGIIVPKTEGQTVSFSETYIYFHGNDKPTVDEMCNGPSGKPYKLCAEVGKLGNPLIIPETNSNGQSSPDLTLDELRCVLSEAQSVAQSEANASLPIQQLAVMGHSGGGFYVMKMLENDVFGVVGTYIFDGCYANWCTTIATTPGIDNLYVYYAKNATTEKTGAQSAYESNGNIKVFEVNGEHLEIPNLCFLDHKNNDACKGTAVSWPAQSAQKWCLTEEKTCIEGSLGGCPRLFDTEAACLAAKEGNSEKDAGENTGATTNSKLAQFANQLNKLEAKTLPALIGVIIKGLMGIIGTVALVMMLYGGILWMTARGNSEATTKARDTILWAGLGIVVIFASYALVDFIFEIFR